MSEVLQDDQSKSEILVSGTNDVRDTEEKFCRLASMSGVQISLQDEKNRPGTNQLRTLDAPGPYLGPKTGIPD